MSAPVEINSFTAAVVDRLKQGRRVRRSLQPYGRLHIDRPLPYLCVYRRQDASGDPGTEWLVVGEGSYLIASGEETAQAGVGELVLNVCAELSAQFGALLLIELWSAKGALDVFFGGALVKPPRFTIHAPDGERGRATVAALMRGLRRLRPLGYRPKVDNRQGGKPTPPGMAPLLTSVAAERLGVLMLGLEVPPIYRDPASGVLFPRVLRELRRNLSQALRRATFRFAHLQTSHRPDHFHRLGQHTVLRAALEADRELSEISDAFSLLLAVTPVNASDAWEEFRAGGYRREPTLRYRLLHWDPEVLKRRLYGISLERVEDPALTELFRDKREELDRQIMLLHDRNTWRFLHGSVQLYGSVEPDLLVVATQILSAPPPAGRSGEEEPDLCHTAVDATRFAEQARREIEAYRSQWPTMDAGVELRDDVVGLLVSQNRLLVDQNLAIERRRVSALLHHEVGTHILTYANASAQKLSLLRTGLPGYDELQEGTAVLAEYLSGGLTRGRLRLLAARVVAVDRRIRGVSFAELFAELRDQYGLRPSSAFSVVLRVFRGGGFTKDAVYLRGLVGLLAYLGRGGDLEPLFLGKVSEQSLPILRELRWREVLAEPPLRPRYLDLPEAPARLERLRRGVSVANLLNESDQHP